MNDVVSAVERLSRSRPIRWLHGYPSLVAEFADFVSRDRTGIAEFLRGNLFGVLLGSEYPAEMYRSKIECVFSSNIVSWYGHSEMAMLAKETARGVYTSLPTYGFAEAVENGDDQLRSCRLVCTSFDNRAHPFVRYDTGDLVKPLAHEGGGLTFEIAEGRVGDFIFGNDGRRISLTSVIFGRHHPAFEHIRHLQVRNEAPGVMTLLVVPAKNGVSVKDLRHGFDLSDLDVECRIELIDAPIRTATGKIGLLVN